MIVCAYRNAQVGLVPLIKALSVSAKFHSLSTEVYTSRGLIHRLSLFDCLVCFTTSFGIESISDTTDTRGPTRTTNKDVSIIAISLLSNKKKTKLSSLVGTAQRVGGGWTSLPPLNSLIKVPYSRKISLLRINSANWQQIK